MRSRRRAGTEGHRTRARGSRHVVRNLNICAVGLLAQVTSHTFPAGPSRGRRREMRRSPQRARLLALALLLPLTALALCAVPAGAAAQSGTPADGPGALSHFDLARKDCVGTARNRTSKVWFTVADGVLSDVYYPTNDNTENETLQYLVTDGATFTDLQTRDMTYTVRALDDRALTCRVTATAKSGRYRIVTDYLTDPGRPTVVTRARLTALKGKLKDYNLYVRFDPTLNGNGGGGSGNGGPDSGAVLRR